MSTASDQDRPRATQLVRAGRWLVARVELAWLVLFALFGGSLWLFLEVAEDVIDGDAHAVDRSIFMTIRRGTSPALPFGPPWLNELARDLTGLGGFVVLLLLTVAAALYLAAMKRSRDVPLLVLSVMGGWGLALLLKVAFDRTRPDLVPHGAWVVTSSFPSGHAMMSAVTYLTIAGLLGRLHTRRRVKVLLLGWGILLSVLVGLSRVYLGVHWPSDVVAGWSVGAAWAIACWAVARGWQPSQVGTERPPIQEPG